MRVVVIGSANLDYVVRVARRPNGGETIMGSDLALTPGGKGANQAVAAGLLEADVAFVGCFGEDTAGDTMRDSLRAAGVDVSLTRRVRTPTGAAVVTVTPDGENSIVVSPGANAHVTPGFLQEVSALAHADIVVMQLEVPLDTIVWAARECGRRRIRFVLNAAPASRLPADILRVCDPLIVNETEAKHLLGLPDDTDPEELTTALAHLGAQSVVITLGAQGSVASTGEEPYICEPATQVKATDTTGAGDAFIGGIVAALARGDSLRDALRLGTRVAGFAVQRRGAQVAYPSLAAVEGSNTAVRR